MAFRPMKIAVLALFPSVAGVWVDISAAQAAQVPSEQSLFYRRYRGDDEVDDERRGRGRGGRSGSSDDNGSISDGGGKSSSGGGSSEGNPKPGTQPSPGQGGNTSDDNDRFGR